MIIKNERINIGSFIFGGKRFVLRSNRRVLAMTFLIIVGMFLAYMQESTLSPVLYDVQRSFGITNDAALNLLSSAFFIGCLIFGFLYAVIDKKAGTKNTFLLAFIFIVLGSAMGLAAKSWIVFLISRFFLGNALGLAVPFCGNAVDIWYSKEDREWMNTINGFLPFTGTLGSFGIASVIAKTFGNWRAILYVWCAIAIIFMILWFFFSKNIESKAVKEDDTKYSFSLYIDVLKNKTVLILSVLYLCDLLTYIYIVLILPTFILEKSMGSISITVASYIAILYPIAAIVGTVIGGTLCKTLGKRKPSLIISALFKLFGLFFMAYYKSPMALSLVSMFVYGCGSGLWMQPLYSIPMEAGLNRDEVTVTFSFLSVMSSIGGFISPTLGGLIADFFLIRSGLEGTAAHVYAMQSALLVLSISCIVSLILSFIIPETGPNK